MDINFIKQKTRKAIRDPKWAIKRTATLCKDIYTSKKIKYRKYIPIKHKGHYQYTVVSAVYNVEKYLDEYFESLVNQSLDFQKHIHLVLVDDGSTDSSAAIIKKWQARYPDNIHYYYKENGGQASARNLGLQHVTTEWVTFIDPDDFISIDYFLNIDRFISKEKNISLIGCPLVFFFEDTHMFRDSHPLKYRFNKGNVTLDFQELNDYFQMSASTAFFRTQEIIGNHILFDSEMKPSFEDAKFVNDYLLRTNQGYKVGFVSDVSYFYRKRSDGTSTLDGAWKNPLLFSKVLSDGCLSILKESKKAFNGMVPVHFQRAVLYHVIWYINRIVDNYASISHLNKEQQEEFINLLFDIFKYIDSKTILKFNLAGSWWFQKSLMISGFKKEKLPKYYAYIENIDREKQQILLSFFTSPDELLEKVEIDGDDIIPSWDKTLKHTFINKVILHERRLWISYKDNINGLLSLYVDNQKVQINLSGKFHAQLGVNQILRAFKCPAKYQSSEDIWLIMDRDMQADDNAEHFYRYVKNNHPEQKIYFALSQKSHDWTRLELEGFNLLDYGSSQFEKILCKSSKIISSHADDYIVNYFGDQYGYSKKFVFLQHGITKDNLSKWLNTKKTLRCFITATYPEYESIASSESPYKFHRHDVALTGFPRHDALLKDSVNNEKTILIMPTWRDYIVGKIAGIGFSRELNKDFTNTLYYQHWNSFLNSEKLKELVEKYEFKVIFAPHANIEPYLPTFNIPDYINIWRAKDCSIQSLFKKSTFMITDYSSVAFEMAYLGKTVCYYQFDKELVFGGGHTTQEGYFSYEKDAFGPVVYTENDLLSSLETILKNQGQPTEPYLTRIKETFPFRDGKNSQRVYEAIKALDKPDEQEIKPDILMKNLNIAYQYKDWQLVKSRAELMLTIGNEDEKAIAYKLWLESLAELGQYELLESELDKIEDLGLVLMFKTKIAWAKNNYNDFVQSLTQLIKMNTDK
ncbi:CDP-glycerol glycerophosphotransferase family protein [Basfia succiniciproducens]|uniref:CDP-glycerol glycerophosphotransferase family protein n=1 Tax=Basfia succiniciproducens TaxID=653940 RepID=UPI0008C24D52|nr:CDP-glycerol glycerophosphotransferase family protein [Basfia succiniciproducens]SEP68357.1 CDP-glycerol glycerophosphotransferase, TagB/SpsB family [Basfia succiniciproducens]